MNQIEIFRILAIASALEFYARHRVQVNASYTPANMLRAASQITGRTFKRGSYIEAAAALRAVLPK